MAYWDVLRKVKVCAPGKSLRFQWLLSYIFSLSLAIYAGAVTRVCVLCAGVNTPVVFLAGVTIHVVLGTVVVT